MFLTRKGDKDKRQMETAALYVLVWLLAISVLASLYCIERHNSKRNFSNEYEYYEYDLIVGV